jgi:acyl-CoA synthetase (NDP forming)
VAIVGLSADRTKHGGRVLGNLRRLGFPGEVWGVNPRRPPVDGIEVFPSLAELPRSPDVVVSAVPAASVPAVVGDAVDVGAGTVIVFAGGFAETGDSGRELQERLAAAAGRGVRVLGPNSGGVIVPSRGLALSFLTCLDRPPDQIRSGRVGLVTQSGGMGSHVHNLAAAAGGGLAASISTGNEVDVDVGEGIAALAEMDEVGVVAVILETVRDGAGFVDAVRKAHSVGKRVVVTRIGRSAHGQRLMRTHTGALARPSRVLGGVLDSLSVPVADTPQEMLEVAEILARTPVPSGPRVGVVTHSGGLAILLSDLADGSGIRLPPPGRGLAAELAPLLDQGSIANPLDMGGIISGGGRFGEVVSAFVRSGDFDLVLVASSAHPPAHTGERVDSLLGIGSDVPVVHLWMAGDQGREGLSRLRTAGSAVTEEPRVAVKAVAALVDAPSTGSLSPGAVGGSAGAAPSSTIEARPRTEHEAKEILRAWGLPVVEGELAGSAEEAVTVADGLGYPVVVKVCSPHVTHKTEIDGVRIGLDDADQVRAAFAQVTETARGHFPEAAMDQVLIERHEPGVEMLVGAVRDETFGSMVMIGFGGADVESRDDVGMALVPIGIDRGVRLIESLAGSGRLTRPRQGEPADLEVLASLTATLGDRFAAETELMSIDLNPVAWTHRGWLVLDAAVESAPC